MTWIRDLPLGSLRIGLIRGGITLVAIAISVAILWGSATLALAQTETETAVITCNSANPLGHGGSADNPPKCVDEAGNEVEVVVKPEQESAQVALPVVGGWRLIAENTETDCATAKATATLEAHGRSTAVGKEPDLALDTLERDPIISISKGCVEIYTRIRAKGSVSFPLK